MKTRTLGKTGFNVSEVGLGCWQLGGDFGPMESARSQAIIDAALRQGINFFDTADVYGGGQSEKRLGEMLKGNDQVHIVSKVGRDGALFPDGYSKQKVADNIKGSLQRLQLEQLDLIQLHCIPPQVMEDGEIFTWLEDFQQQGLIKHFGASVETIDEALLCLKHAKLATLQIIFNLFRQDAISGLFDKAQQANVGIIVRLPLASGLLSGKMSASQQFDESDHRYFNRDGEYFNVGETFSGLPFQQGIHLVDELKEIIGHGTPPLSQISLRWILDHPAVSTVIAGASRPEHVLSNAQASKLPPLSDKLHQQLSTFYIERVRQHVRGRI